MCIWLCKKINKKFLLENEINSNNIKILCLSQFEIITLILFFQLKCLFLLPYSAEWDREDLTQIIYSDTFLQYLRFHSLHLKESSHVFYIQH